MKRQNPAGALTTSQGTGRALHTEIREKLNSKAFHLINGGTSYTSLTHEVHPLRAAILLFTNVKAQQPDDGGTVPANLPYLSTPGSIKTVLERIRHAATPSRVTGDFIATVIQIKGGAGRSIPPFLKRIGMVASDGAPTDLYKAYRNEATAGKAMAQAIKHGYQELNQSNEYFYRLSDKELLALIVQVTGVGSDSRAAVLTLATIKNLKISADFDASDVNVLDQNVRTNGSADAEALSPSPQLRNHISRTDVGLNLSYTINLNLPATADQAVFNAIFRSLKEHLLAANA
jgi:hypothetical protein